MRPSLPHATRNNGRRLRPRPQEHTTGMRKMDNRPALPTAVGKLTAVEPQRQRFLTVRIIVTTFHSTRSTTDSLTSKQAIRLGLADDGGLFVSDQLGETKVSIDDLAGMSYQAIAQRVLGALLPDFTEEELAQCIAEAYGNSGPTRRSPRSSRLVTTT